MRSLLSNLSPWISTTGFIVEKNMDIRVSLLLQDGAMTFPFLYIEDLEDEDVFCLIPVTKMIEIYFNESAADIVFTNYNDIHVFAVFSEQKSFEILLDQFRLTSHISTNIFDEYYEQNMSALTEFQSRTPYGYPLSFYDLFKTKGGLSPVSFYKKSEEVWMERSTFINTLYFTETVPIKLNIMTWNVSCHKPIPEVKNQIEKSIADDPDIVFYSLQEIEMSTKSVVTGSSSYAIGWKTIIEEALEKTDLEIAEQISLGGTFGLVAIKKNNTNLTYKDAKSVRLGAHGMGANKAAILFNIKAGFANICFCACHLSSGSEALDERNQQLIKIQKLAPRKTDYLFICGDMNYRTKLHYDECIALLDDGRADEVLRLDQLTEQINTIPEMKELQEGEILFMPTYKFDKDLDIYDTSPKRRTPSYTDRVLVRKFPPRLTTGLIDSLQFESDVIHHYADERVVFPMESYFSSNVPEPNYPLEPENVYYDCGDCRISDHRAVFSNWDLMIPGINEKRKKKFEELLEKKLNEIASEEEARGVATPDKVSLKVGEKFKITLENTSLVWAYWNAQTLSDKISVFPSKGVSIPGIPTIVELLATEYVDEQQLILFNSTHGTLCSLEVEIQK